MDKYQQIYKSATNHKAGLERLHLRGLITRQELEKSLSDADAEVCVDFADTLLKAMNNKDYDEVMAGLAELVNPSLLGVFSDEMRVAGIRMVCKFLETHLV